MSEYFAKIQDLVENSDFPVVHETVVHMLVEAANRSPDSTALTFEGRELTYAQYLRCIKGFANELAELGAQGSRVALVCGNSIEIAVAMFAAHAVGAQAVPINPLYTERELAYILSDSDPRVVIYDEEIKNNVEPLIEKEDGITGICVGGNQGRLLDSWSENETVDFTFKLPKAEQLATLQYTGGTTGLPKGVNITHGQMSINISQREAVLPTNFDDERIICVMPMFHVFAVSMCLHLAAYCRGELAILSRYKPEFVFQVLQNRRITRFPAGPTVFIGLMGADGFTETDFSSLRTAYSGSAPMPEEVLKEWESLTGCPILEGYGQSEAGPILTYIGENMEPIAGSVGPAVALTEVQIVDVEDGNKVLGVGEIGEIRASGPQIMSGYRNLPDETAETLVDGWLYTGDIGELDEDGNLYIRDRKKDMVISGGYNVYPREVEEVLFTQPNVVEAAVIGVPDSYRGEVLKAYVVLKEETHNSVAEIFDFCRQNLARYKVPQDILSINELPRTVVGKVDKVTLRGSNN